MFFCAGS
jgi:ribosome assembly protein RRB1